MITEQEFYATARKALAVTFGNYVSHKNLEKYRSEAVSLLSRITNESELNYDFFTDTEHSVFMNITEEIIHYSDLMLRDCYVNMETGERVFLPARTKVDDQNLKFAYSGYEVSLGWIQGKQYTKNLPYPLKISKKSVSYMKKNLNIVF